LERLKAQYDPEWEREVKSGRINASRLLRGCELDEAFDKWRNGRDDAVDIEAVILLDNSGSMDGDRSVHASNAMWGLKRALDKVNASCTVLTFSEAVHMLYPAQEQAGITVKRTQPRGGTDPTKALKYAQRVFADSDRAVKVLFTITDGAWSGNEADETIKVLRTAGVVTALAFINESPMEVIDPHNSEVVSHITNARDLLFLGRNLVKVATNRNLNP
jgi:Mg-chelatase subunit ChlD